VAVNVEPPPFSPRDGATLRAHGFVHGLGRASAFDDDGLRIGHQDHWSMSETFLDQLGVAAERAYFAADLVFSEAPECQDQRLPLEIRRGDGHARVDLSRKELRLFAGGQQVFALPESLPRVIRLELRLGPDEATALLAGEVVARAPLSREPPSAHDRDGLTLQSPSECKVVVTRLDYGNTTLPSVVGESPAVAR
ncbi:MAG: hypothetical protein KC731_12700, partial [Myxococcales bacterium]|nr:hypothetical protein [Myxococcales bacterium]